jgi:hypothetical protein
MTDNKALKQQFRSSIRRGTGEAHLILQRHPAIDFSADIIKAAIWNYAYDAQSEGSRAVYIAELMARSQHPDKIRKAILTGLATEENDTWALVQLFDLAKMLAQKGDQEARQAIYNRFYNKIVDSSPWCGYSAIIELDGFKGLQFIATTIGKAMEKDPSIWDDNSIIDHFQKDHPEINAWSALEEAGQNNRFIKIYLDNIAGVNKEREQGLQERPRLEINYTTVTERIKNKVTVPLMPGRGKQLSPTDLKKLADDFLQEKDRLKLEKYCRIFDQVKYPYDDYQPLLALAKSKYLKTDRLVEFASGALKYFTGSDIRQFAINKLTQTRSPYRYLQLLVANYKKGDHRLLTKIALAFKNENDIHAIADGYTDIYAANPTKECKEPLEAIYSKLTCGVCRGIILRRLIDNKVLSKQLKQEMQYDSYEDNRAL